MKYSGLLAISLVLTIPQIGFAQDSVTPGIQKYSVSEQTMLIAEATGQETTYQGIPADDVSTNNDEANTASEASQGNEPAEPEQNGEAAQNSEGN